MIDDVIRDTIEGQTDCDTHGTEVPSCLLSTNRGAVNIIHSDRSDLFHVLASNRSDLFHVLANETFKFYVIQYVKVNV